MELDYENLPDEPLPVLQAWVSDASERSGMDNPGAMSLATIDPDGRPSARIVLLRGLDERGAVFYTNRDSRKGDALSVHPRAALVLHWDSLKRQVRIEGTITLTSDEESDAYWKSRPRESRIAAWASEQSRPIEDRAALERAFEHFDERFPGDEVPRPDSWGGYRVSLERVEFWEGRDARLHDRVEYVLHDGTWKVTRLAP